MDEATQSRWREAYDFAVMASLQASTWLTHDKHYYRKAYSAISDAWVLLAPELAKN